MVKGLRLIQFYVRSRGSQKFAKKDTNAYRYCSLVCVDGVYCIESDKLYVIFESDKLLVNIGYNEFCVLSGHSYS
jgi:hypothetical protein